MQITLSLVTEYWCIAFLVSVWLLHFLSTGQQSENERRNLKRHLDRFVSETFHYMFHQRFTEWFLVQKYRCTWMSLKINHSEPLLFSHVPRQRDVIMLWLMYWISLTVASFRTKNLFPKKYTHFLVKDLNTSRAVVVQRYCMFEMPL